eukprot:CAMPEP_0184860956 /NCGR_PEP_ID=MMETSP0580-20130426/5736_1 /TAXON_ID=1118495 /ORGANISM="Dactyliosolen fragilissimus" /LENGTH=1311 /DNA_ID=CAMNT_0027358245 /DNA_START=78 /DNA_END=4013 /DNA_ORIENTATION=-
MYSSGKTTDRTTRTRTKTKTTTTTTPGSESSRDKAALAYAAISSQLAEWGTPANHSNNSLQSENFDVDNDGLDQSFGSNYVSRRISGALSPLAAATPTTTSDDLEVMGDEDVNKNDNNINRSYSRSISSNSGTKSRVDSSARKNRNVSVSFADRAEYEYSTDGKNEEQGLPPVQHTPISGTPYRPYRSSPVSTPSNILDEDMREGDDMEEEAKEDYGNHVGVEDIVMMEERNTSSSSFVGRYSAYSDALQCLLGEARASLSSSPTSIRSNHYSKIKDAMGRFLDRLAGSCRAQCFKHGDEDNILGGSDGITQDHKFALSEGGDLYSSSEVVAAAEGEGNVWSLLVALLDGCAHSQSFADDNIFDFILWNNGSNSAERGRFYDRQRHHIDMWINALTDECVTMDQISLHQVLSSRFDLPRDSHYAGEKEYESMDIDNDEKVNLPLAVPDLVKRRQIILSWIESCNARHVPSLNVLCRHANNNNIMWKDTVHYLNSNSKYSTNSNHTLESIHPDAPFIANTTLLGNDEAQEIYILSSCMALLKAGRFEDALDMCSQYGQPWRVASWRGNEVYGVLEIVDSKENGDDDNAKEADHHFCGNPHRPIWKRTMWKIGHTLNSKLLTSIDNDPNMSQNTTKFAGGSLAYDAAITSTLADDTQLALSSPVLHKHWIDGLWTYFHGMQARFLEQIYCSHNQARRERRKKEITSIANVPMEGTEYEKEEKEQLVCTTEMSRIQEDTIMSNLGKKHGGLFSNSNSDWKDSDIWMNAMSSFISGVSNVEVFVQWLSSHLSNYLSDDNQEQSSVNENSNLRFVIHIILFIELLCELDDNKDTAIKNLGNVVSQSRNLILDKYLGHLMSRKSLWHLVGFYSSLLPQDNLVSITVEFWVTSVSDDKDRRLVLSHARKFFPEGLDLIILRDVIQYSIRAHVPTGDDLQAESESCFPSALLYLLPPMSKSDHPTGRMDINEVMEKQILRGDLWMMHSIHWLCYYPEHFTDALIYANTILRKFLLQTKPFKEDSLACDTVDDLKFYTAQAFITRFVPHSLVDAIIEEYEKEDDDRDALGLGRSVVQNGIHEHSAISAYFEAQNVFNDWKTVITNINPTVAVSDLSTSSGGDPNSLEYSISNKMIRKLYVDKKKELGLQVINISEMARCTIIEAIVSLSQDLGENNINDEGLNDEVYLERGNELSTLKQKLIPNMVFLLVNILDETAKWIDDFVQDITFAFGKEESKEILLRIHRKILSTSSGEERDECGTSIISSPFLPQTWSRKILHLADDIASEDNKLYEYFEKNKMKIFMNYMAEASVQLLIYQQE